jgi:hypothetical protein
MRASKQLRALLKEQRETILDKWFELIIGTYPEVTTRFLATQKDRFRNPVGYAITESIGPIYDQIASAMDTDQILRALDGIIRIRSVQEFSPSQAVGFVFQLKNAIREVADDRVGGLGERSDLGDLESRIDRVALLAFEKYTECREQLHRVRNREIQSRARRVLDAAKGEGAALLREEEITDDDV